MLDSFPNVVSKLVLKAIERDTSYLSMFVSLDSGPEEWFRMEILKEISAHDELTILTTNQKHNGIAGRPDFVLLYDDIERIVELKVLPIDRNYSRSYQRFCAGKTNKADFDALSNGESDLVVYVHWADRDDFEHTKTKLLKRYSVDCVLDQEILFDDGVCSLSYWRRLPDEK